jgi:hypothetical protein
MPIPASAQKPVAAEPDNAGLGILLMMGAVAAFAVIDTCAKVLVRTCSRSWWCSPATRWR